MELTFLPGVPAAHVLARLALAGGNEVASGKIQSPDSSAALAVNCFGWFIPRPALLPPFPGITLDYPAQRVEVEFEARFPWAGGTHPWLDAAVITADHLIGVESKRFEPFRDLKKVSFSPRYNERVWGDAMEPYERLRDQLVSGERRFEYLDATQLVKHAFGLRSAAQRSSKTPILLYVFAEPSHLGTRPIAPEVLEQHRADIRTFGDAVAGAEVAFHAISYRAWIATWPDTDAAVAAHGAEVLRAYDP